MSVAIRIRQKVDTLGGLDPKRQIFGSNLHQHTLNPGASEEAIAHFEAKHGIRLPEDYRFFLKEIGNGGAGPGYGLLPLEELETELFDPLAEPFPHTEAAFIEDDEVETDIPRPGALPILTYGCAYFALLIVTGPERGKIWFGAETGHEPVTVSPTDATHADFLSWYEQWLDVFIYALSNKMKTPQSWDFGNFHEQPTPKKGKK